MGYVHHRKVCTLVVCTMGFVGTWDVCVPWGVCTLEDMYHRGCVPMGYVCTMRVCAPWEGVHRGGVYHRVCGYMGCVYTMGVCAP